MFTAPTSFIAGGTFQSVSPPLKYPESKVARHQTSLPAFQSDRIHDAHSTFGSAGGHRLRNGGNRLSRVLAPHRHCDSSVLRLRLPQLDFGAASPLF